MLTMVAVVGRGMLALGGRRARGAARAGQQRRVDRRGRPAPFYRRPPFKLTDQDGKPFDSEQLKGQVWVAALIFTNCPGVCPSMTQKLKELQDAVPAKNVQLVSFTVDPERDTPEVLKQYARRFKADESRWHFLTGEKDTVFAAADGLKLSASPGAGRPADRARGALPAGGRAGPGARHLPQQGRREAQAARPRRRGAGRVLDAPRARRHRRFRDDTTRLPTPPGPLPPLRRHGAGLGFILSFSAPSSRSCSG